MNVAVEPISYREEVPEIPHSGYPTHGIHYYPARFIPQIVRYHLTRTTVVGDCVLDPFAGSGTVGVEAFVNNRKCVLFDINPILNHLIQVKCLAIHQAEDSHLRDEIGHTLRAVRQETALYLPQWRNLEYWHPSEFVPYLGRLWHYVHCVSDSPVKVILEFAALRVTRFLSFAARDVPKLFKSKRRTAEIAVLLKSDWRTLANETFRKACIDYFRMCVELGFLVGRREPEIESFGGVDSYSHPIPERDYAAIITSPPYLQAQEYIRSSKLDLYWLGYSEEEVRRLSQLEIPYRKAAGVVSTPTLDQLRNKINEERFVATLDAYFWYVCKTLERCSSRLIRGGHLCIFVGSPAVRGQVVPIWRILGEYLSERGWRVERVLVDRIKARKLFSGRQNLNPDGMDREFMLVLRKVT